MPATKDDGVFTFSRANARPGHRPGSRPGEWAWATLAEPYCRDGTVGKKATRLLDDLGTAGARVSLSPWCVLFVALYDEAGGDVKYAAYEYVLYRDVSEGATRTTLNLL